MLEVSFLGTGGWIATAERDNTSFLISQDKDLILIDCPGGVIQKIKRLNFDPCRIHSILITHIHPDHIYGLPSFVHSLMLEDCLIDLYGSKRTVQFCREFMDLFHLRDKKIKTRINFKAVQPEKDFSLAGSVECSPLETPHSSSSLAFSFYFKVEGKRLLYSGDTPVHPPLFQKGQGVDFLIHECSAPMRFFKKYPSLFKLHTNSLDLGNLAQKAEVKCLVPCHFFADLGFPFSEIEDEIRRNFHGQVIIPEDFQKIVIG